MSVKRILFLFIVAAFAAASAFAQTNKVEMTVKPSAFPDTIHKPTLIMNDVNASKTVVAPQTNIETKTVTPERNLSIGHASMVNKPVKESAKPVTNETLNYTEQKRESEKSQTGKSASQPK